MKAARRKPNFDLPKKKLTLSTIPKPIVILSQQHYSKDTTRTDDPDKPVKFLGIRLGDFLLPTLIAFRLLNAFLINTTFVPDEVWQSVEVAHNWVFGYGALTWEWQSSVAIRSPFYPLIFAGIFKVLAMCNLDSREAIILAPRLFHGFLTALTDYTVYKMTLALCDRRSAKWVLFAEVTSWFVAYCGPRSLSNSIEWSLHAVAFLFYPWDPASGVDRSNASPTRFLLHVCICVILRPTAAILWVPVCLHYLYRKWRKSWEKVSRTSLLGVIIGTFCVSASVCVDRMVYGRWTLNQINFLRFNLLSNGADFYGVEPFHWYLTNGLPTMLTCHLPLALIGWFIDVATEPTGIHWLMKFRDLSRPLELRAERAVARTFGLWIAWTVWAYSYLSHKEFRFLFPLMPLFVFYAGRGLLHLNRGLRERRVKFLCSPMKVIVGLLVLSNILVAGYTCLVHQRGPNQLMDAFGRKADADNWNAMAEKPRVLILMPCHTTPYLSYLHHNIHLRLLGCEPDLRWWHNQTDDAIYVDEAEVFYSKPLDWLEAHYPLSGDRSRLPHYIAMFTHLVRTDGIAGWLKHPQRNYRPCAKIFHAHVLSHSRHSEHIAVWCAPDWNMTTTYSLP